MVERYEAEGKAKRISAVPAPEVVFEEVVKVVGPLFGAPSTQVGGLHRAVIRCHEGPATTLTCRPLRQNGPNITARPAHQQAALLGAVFLASVAHRPHVTGHGSQQPAVAGQLHVVGCTALSGSQQVPVGHCTAPSSRGRTAFCCALPPVRRSATSRARQLLHAALSASTTQQGQDGCAQGEAGRSGGKQAVSLQSSPATWSHMRRCPAPAASSQHPSALAAVCSSVAWACSYATLEGSHAGMMQPRPGSIPMCARPQPLAGGQASEGRLEAGHRLPLCFLHCAR